MAIVQTAVPLMMVMMLLVVKQMMIRIAVNTDGDNKINNNTTNY